MLFGLFVFVFIFVLLIGLLRRKVYKYGGFKGFGKFGEFLLLPTIRGCLRCLNSCLK